MSNQLREYQRKRAGYSTGPQGIGWFVTGMSSEPKVHSRRLREGRGSANLRRVRIYSIRMLREVAVLEREGLL